MIAKLVSWFKTTTGSHLRRLLTLLSKVVLVILLSLLAGWAWLVLLELNQVLEDDFLKLMLVAGLGLATGILARLILKPNTRILRALTAFISLWCNLVALFAISGGRVGFNPFSAFLAEINWDGLWQVLLGGLIAWLALSAWRVTLRPRSDAAAGQQAQSVQPATQAQDSNRPLKAARKKEDAPKAKSKAPSGNHRHPPQAVTPLRPSFRPLAASSSPTQKASSPAVKFERASRANQKPLRPAPGRHRHKAIHLIGTEEHRCPYCLEEVDPKDPQGVVICPVCHTYHHKTCWDVTGTCQVPHLTQV